MPHRKLLLLPILLAIPLGCSTSPRDDGFSDVQHLVAQRSAQQIQWNRGSDADRAVEQQVQTLLDRPLTLDQALQIALLNNPDLQMTYEELGIAQADLVEAGLLRNPVFDGSLRWPTDGTGGAKVELAVTQSFIDLLFIPARKRLAEANLEAAKARVGDAVLKHATNVRESFYTVQAAQQTLELRRRVADTLQASADLAQRMHEAGNVNEFALTSEQAAAEQARIDLETAEAELVDDRERLQLLLGIADDPSWQIAGRLPDPMPLEPAPKELQQIALDQRLDLAAARAHITSSARSLGLTRTTRFIPEAALGASAEREPAGGWVAGPAFSFPIPLFDFGQGAIPRAQSQLRQAQRQYVSLAAQVRSQVRQAHSHLLKSRARVERYQASLLPLRQRTSQYAQLLYNGMYLSPFELLRTKQEEIEAGQRYIEALRDYWIARSDLERAVGGKLTALATTRPAAATQSTQPVFAPATQQQDHQHHH